MPGKLGFYDLRLPETRQAQAELAQTHGIEAFCYWHYWFGGKRLLERPFEEVLASGRPDFPFCLAWANETWSRRWLGEEKEILLKQTYSPDDDRQHARWLARAFADTRYFHVNGRPLFLIYRPRSLPDPRRTAETIRQECKRAGVADPLLLGINSYSDIDYRTLGFDGTVDFEPQFELLDNPMRDGVKIYDYVAARARMASRQREHPVYPGIFVSWDNTPRRGDNGIVFSNCSPEHFEAGLRAIVQMTLAKPKQERLVFVNVWNEWAEGNHLEPDMKHGLRYLQAARRANLAVEDDKVRG
jgi:lipopolysaccharide biosynthesis protein